ncbi:MAG: N-acetylmuramoyl-L-alanine amidase [Deltaproteobacteria bacterium]|nr:N-acetylmuramoyl-L-alanine amidase [Deltaproteobacteria bacterium]MCL5791638.1 N-acetylmuramoyl-L-alanine amidase [Deltaproteobacteria bacterium]
MVSALFFAVVVISSNGHKYIQPKTLYGEAVQNYYILHSNPQKQQYRDNWLNVISAFKHLYKRYPKSSYAPKALFNIGNLYNNLYNRSFLEEDLDKSISAFKELIKNYKKSPLADDALLKIAEIYRTKKGNQRIALTFYKSILKKYPRSDSAPIAKLWIVKLGGNIPEQKTPAKLLPAIITGIKFWSTNDYTRVVIDLSKDVAYTGHLLEQTENGKIGKRVYVDLSGASITGDTAPIIVKDGLVERIREGQFKPSTARVVLDLGNITDYSIFNLEDPFRIIIDVKGRRNDKAMTLKTSNPTVTSILTQSSTVSTEKRQTGTTLTIGNIIKKYEDLRDENNVGHVAIHHEQQVKSVAYSSIKTIVIDPGHGGKDPGAIGPDGVEEKNITLAIGRILADRLRKIGFHVIMTRDTNVFIPLEERTAIADMRNADLFISIHANASIDRRTKGITTYYLSPASDRNSLIVAARENATSAKKLSDLQLILEDLMKTAKINDSNMFAQDVQKSMVSELRLNKYKTPNLGVRGAPFYVLMHTSMPSILIETSFVTNPAEERLLTEKRYQDTIVDGVVKGILKYGSKIKMAYQ